MDLGANELEVVVKPDPCYQRFVIRRDEEWQGLRDPFGDDLLWSVD